MTTTETYHDIMSTATHIAFATAALDGHTPTVRIVNFVYFEETPNTIYINTNRDTVKVKELENSSTVSFTTTPVPAGNVRVTGATAQLALDQQPKIFAAMDEKYGADFKRFDAEARAKMNTYAITFADADVFSRGLDKLTFSI